MPRVKTGHRPTAANISKRLVLSCKQSITSLLKGESPINHKPITTTSRPGLGPIPSQRIAHGRAHLRHPYHSHSFQIPPLKTMATSLSLTNFLSFLSPKTPPPPNQLTLSSLPQKSKDNVTTKFSVLVAQDGRSGSALSPELSTVINPSFANANTLYYKSAYNVQVIVDDNEPEERLLNRFRREVMRAGVIQECKRRRFFENKQDEKKRKSREAAKRNRRRRPQFRSSSASNRQEPTTGKKDEDDEDNWEMPEGDLPY